MTPVTRADLGKNPNDVRRMFDAVARRYDVTNDVLSLGQDRRWRRDVIDAVDPRPGRRWSSTWPPARVRRASRSPTAGATVVPCDFSLGMLQVGKEAKPHLPFTAGDGTRLPFADATFDAVTISFGLRNIVDPLAGLREMLPGHPARRSPGGLRVQPPDLGAVPHRLRRVPDEGAAARSPARCPRARTPTSTSRSRSAPGRTSRDWPSWIGGAGWSDVEWRNLSGGIVALHRATA